MSYPHCKQDNKKITNLVSENGKNVHTVLLLWMCRENMLCKKKNNIEADSMIFVCFFHSSITINQTEKRTRKMNWAHRQTPKMPTQTFLKSVLCRSIGYFFVLFCFQHNIFILTFTRMIYKRNSDVSLFLVFMKNYHIFVDPLLNRFFFFFEQCTIFYFSFHSAYKFTYIKNVWKIILESIELKVSW